MSEIRLENVTKVYAGGVRAVDDVNLTIESGEFMVLVGPSGCGKTTLLRMIAGLDGVDGGAIRLGDRDITHLEPRERDIAMVFQNYALYPHMSVRENLSCSASMTCSTGGPERSPADSVSALRWVARSRAGRRSI